ncbi:cell wall hydrolase [Beijerinckia indica]|uniref:Cell wall hydrolase SleB n=1 Tax=Beijerinckia indica subsp. indica (strain ATCC 9039 / DSM 1715 / NCIMB 8712) TaxID=395963 RepID=B2IHI5_BEII9|nr:cell wall hydrolase [Beijerinckia indica]ACB94506.1 cell wall hydrolase SleB [Beijerinckia indica subsp. indica ATCC 9039]
MGIVAPWCLAMGLLVSISADAGQEAVMGGSIVALSQRAAVSPTTLVPDLPLDSLTASPRLSRNFAAVAALRQVSLELGEKQDFSEWADEIEPRPDLKRSGRASASKAMPVIDRSRKGDPLVGLRPTFDTQLRQKGGLAKLRAHDLLFTHDETSPTGGFSPAEGDVEGPESVASFEPWPDGESPTTVHAAGDASPAATGSTTTRATVAMRPSALNERLMQGATPATPRALALASTTPAPAEATPVEVVFQRSKNAPETSYAERQKPNYAALISQDRAGSEKRCLAEAIYFEARSEPEEGQAAVAQVVLNRVSSGLYPASICGVVYQNRQHYHGCQFSFACEGKSLKITEPDAWRTALKVADSVTEGRTYLADIGGSTHYHANYVRPRWAKALKKMDVIGHHIFYKLRPGQT